MAGLSGGHVRKEVRTAFHRVGDPAIGRQGELDLLAYTALVVEDDEDRKLFITELELDQP